MKSSTPFFSHFFLFFFFFFFLKQFRRRKNALNLLLAHVQRYFFIIILIMRVCHKKENGHFFLKSKKKNGHGKWGVQRKAHFFDAHFFLFKKNPIQKNGCGGAIGDPFFFWNKNGSNVVDNNNKTSGSLKCKLYFQ